MIIENIKKDYGTHKTVVLYRHPFEAEAPRCQLHLEINCQICFKRGKLKDREQLNESQLQQYYSNRKRSTRRAKNTVTDYALCNKFELFITLTFNQKLNDSFDYDYCKKLVSKWINNQRRHSPQLRYILVAEKHKSGAIHFHALFGNYNGILSPAINNKKNSKYFGKEIYKNGKQIFNLDGWKYGFSTASYIKNTTAAARYIQKYLTKDFIEAFNKKRFWVSRGLIKPVKTFNIDYHEEQKDYLPIFTELFKTENYYMYTWKTGSERLEDIKKFTTRKINAIVPSH